jgi:periplasmic protein TonB
MITHYPLATHVIAPPPRRDPPVAVVNAGSWRYAAGRPTRLVIGLAMLISAGVHAGILFGFRKPAAKPVVRQKEELRIALIPPPEIKDLEEPEPAPSENTTPVDLGMLVPMQQDVPQLPQPSDFVQQVNFASLLEQPDFSNVKMNVIPEHIRTAGSLAEKIGRIFNPEDLDRIPEAVLQPAPTYPVAMRREGVTGTVHVEFVVDAEGRVLAPFVFESSHPGFDDAAIAGVLRWKFRPGVKAGKRVPTRMRVPIVFKTTDMEL